MRSIARTGAAVLAASTMLAAAAQMQRAASTPVNVRVQIEDGEVNA